MPSNFDTFEVMSRDRETGEDTVYPGAVVQVRDFSGPGAPVRLLPDLVADGGGVVVGGVLPVDVGSSVRFSWQDDPTGINGFAEVVTT